MTDAELIDRLENRINRLQTENKRLNHIVTNIDSHRLDFVKDFVKLGMDMHTLVRHYNLVIGKKDFEGDTADV